MRTKGLAVDLMLEILALTKGVEREVPVDDAILGREREVWSREIATKH